MAHQTVERRANELAVGDRVLRKDVAWYVDGISTGASGDIDVTYRLTQSRTLKSTQTYASDDPVDVIVGGFPDRPKFTSESRQAVRQAVQEWVRQAVRPGPR